MTGAPLGIHRIRHALTFDVEDWFHGIPIEDARRSSFESRIERGLGPLLEMLGERRIRATFFVLGPLAISHRHLIARIADGGHELGCHGWSHAPIYTMDRDRFVDETRRASDAIREVIGGRVLAYRAAYFSITRRSLWALDALAALGFTADSSIFPVRNWRYGIAGFDPRPQRIETSAGPIMEFPISVRRLLGQNVPVGGGAYFRLYPYALTRANMRDAEAEGRPVVFYLHPWELDAQHPRVPFHWRARLTHYANIASTRPKLERLLDDFSFGTLTEVLAGELARSRS